MLDRSEILPVVQHFVTDLKRSGSTFKARSPWNEEKTPSFYVVPAKNIFKCHSSGHGGGPVKFLQLMGKSYPEAIEFLADQNNILLEYDQAKEVSSEKTDKRREALAILMAAEKRFQSERSNTPFREWQESRGISDETALQWGLGYAPLEWQFLSDPIIESGHQKVAKEIGLVSEKKGKTFDFFQGRVMFPIRNHRDELVGFGGRLVEHRKGGAPAKYFNPKDSFCYDKSRILYGLSFARQEIAKTRTTYITEGYMDCIAMHVMGITNTVAVCGTALTREHLRSLGHISDNLVMVLDADAAGERATERAIHAALPLGFQVEVVKLPPGEDPDDLRSKHDNPEDYRKAIDDQRSDAVVHLLSKWSLDADSPSKKGSAGEKMCKLIGLIPNSIAQSDYLKTAAKLLDVSLKDLRKQLDSIEKEDEGKEVPTVDRIDENNELHASNLTFDDITQLRLCGFLGGKAGYRFPVYDKSGDVTRLFYGTNFQMEPLYHVLSDIPDENKRLMRFTHPHKTVIIDMPSSTFASKMDFQKALLQKGPFMFSEHATQLHFGKLMSKYVNEFPECIEVEQLGLQPEGFFAFANGIVDRGEFRPVDDRGIVEYKSTAEGMTGEMETRTQLFYFPAFSSIYRDTRSMEDKYQNDRFFVYREPSVQLDEWMALMFEVYGQNGIAGIIYAFSCVYRDIYFNVHKNFPLLFAQGEKSSGKGTFCQSVQALFLWRMPEFNLNNGTPVGFQSRLARLSGAINWFDEYRNDIDEQRFQGLKGAFDGVGREKGRLGRSNSTIQTQVRSGSLISGQHYPDRDDQALTSRCIMLEFVKNVDAQSKTEAPLLELQKLQKQGLSGLLVQLLGYRGVMKDRLLNAFIEMRDLIKARLGEHEYERRVLHNYSLMLAVGGVLMQESDLNFPFKFNELIDWAVGGVKKVSVMMGKSDGAAGFWEVLTVLVDKGENAGDHFNGGLRARYEFEILSGRDHYTIKKGGQSTEVPNHSGCSILALRFKAVHQAYSKEVRSQTGKQGMSKMALENAFRSRKYYLGVTPSHQFENQRTSALLFDADKLREMGYDFIRKVEKRPSDEWESPTPPPDNQEELAF